MSDVQERVDELCRLRAENADLRAKADRWDAVETLMILGDVELKQAEDGGYAQHASSWRALRFLSNVNLNGFTLASKEAPPAHQPVILGYRVNHLPEVWFGIGYRDPSHVRDMPDRYWLGPRGCDPHYDGLSADDVILWRAFDKPFSFEDDTRHGSTYLQWRWILGDPEEDAAFAADETNAAYWDAEPAASIELPWQPANGQSRSAGWPWGAAQGTQDCRGYIVATGHPLGFGVNGGNYLPHDTYGRTILILDPTVIPDTLWRDGAVPPERTVRGYHVSRFSVGEFNGWPQSNHRDYAPLLSMHNGSTSDGRLHWSPASGRGHDGHGLLRWISFRDLWYSLPEAVRNDHRYEWRGMRRGYERVEKNSLIAQAPSRKSELEETI